MAHLETSERTDTELALIAALIADPSKADIAAGRVRKKDFCVEAHGKAFEHILLLAESGQPIDDRRLVLGSLSQAGLIGDTGAMSIRKQELTDAVFDAVPENTIHYCNQIVKWAQLFEIRRATAETNEMLNDPAADPLEVSNRASRKLEEISQRTVLSTESVYSHASKLAQEINATEKVDRRPTIGTGIYMVDQLTGGFAPSELVVIGARPSNGKTSLAMQVLEHSAVDRSARCLLISLEMKGREIAQRMLCARAKVQSQMIRSGEVTAGEKKRLRDAAEELRDFPIEVSDDGGSTIRRIRAIAKITAVTSGLDLLAVDYLSIVKPDDGSKPRHEQMAQIAQGLKDLAMELNIPVIALAQLNRKAGDKDERPKMSQIRESGHVEQCADVVILLHNPPRKSEGSREEPKYSAEIIVEKARQARTGVIEVMWDTSTLQFEDRAGSSAAIGI